MERKLVDPKKVEWRIWVALFLGPAQVFIVCNSHASDRKWVEPGDNACAPGWSEA